MVVEEEENPFCSKVPMQMDSIASRLRRNKTPAPWLEGETDREGGFFLLLPPFLSNPAELTLLLPLLVLLAVLEGATASPPDKEILIVPGDVLVTGDNDGSTAKR